MNKSIPLSKRSKREKKRSAAEKRVLWAFSPVTRTKESKKRYRRKKISPAILRDDRGDFFMPLISGTH